MKPCDQCPWASKAARDKKALTPEVRQAARNGEWFCCHVNMGTCHGAAIYHKRYKLSHSRTVMGRSNQNKTTKHK